MVKRKILNIFQIIRLKNYLVDYRSSTLRGPTKEARET